MNAPEKQRSFLVSWSRAARRDSSVHGRRRRRPGVESLESRRLLTSITEIPVTAGTRPVSIAAGPDGNLWFTEGTGNKVGNFWGQGWIYYLGPVIGALIAAFAYDYLYLRPPRPAVVGTPESGVAEPRPGDTALD